MKCPDCGKPLYQDAIHTCSPQTKPVAWATPTRIEIEDGHTVLAVVKMFDEGGSSVKVKTLVNPEAWRELSALIEAALEQMHPERKQ